MINNLKFEDDGRAFVLNSDGVVTRIVAGESTEGTWSSSNDERKNKLTLSFDEDVTDYPVRYRFLNRETDSLEQNNVLKVAVLGSESQVLGEARFHGTLKADDATDLDYVLNDDTKFTLYGSLVLEGDYSFLNIRLEDSETNVARVRGKPIIQPVIGPEAAGRTMSFGFSCYTLDLDDDNGVEFESDGEIGLKGSVRAKKNGLTFVGSVAEDASDLNIALIGRYDSFSGGIAISGDADNPEARIELAGEWKLNSVTGKFSLSLTKDEENTLNFEGGFEFATDETGENGETRLKGKLTIASEDGGDDVEVTLGLNGSVKLNPGSRLVFELDVKTGEKKVQLSLKGKLTWSTDKSFTFKLGYSDDNIELTIHLKTQKLDAWIKVIKKTDGTAQIGFAVDLDFDVAGNLNATPIA